MGYDGVDKGKACKGTAGQGKATMSGAGGGGGWRWRLQPAGRLAAAAIAGAGAGGGNLAGGALAKDKGKARLSVCCKVTMVKARSMGSAGVKG